MLLPYNKNVFNTLQIVLLIFISYFIYTGMSPRKVYEGQTSSGDMLNLIMKTREDLRKVINEIDKSIPRNKRYHHDLTNHERLMILAEQQNTKKER
jgi:hypothetical protein